MDDLNDIKNMWAEINNRLAALEEENRRLLHHVKSENYRSIKQRLISRYRFFIVMSLLCALVFALFIVFNPMIVETYRWITAIYWLVFFILCASVDFYLLQNVGRMDIYNSSVSETARIAAKNWKIHKLWIIVGLPFAIGAVILWALALNADYFVILGMIAGGIVGFIIGLYQLKKFMRDYKQLQSEDPAFQ